MSLEFHNGDTVDAEDVKASLERWRTVGPKGPGLATVVLLTVAAITPILGAGGTGKSALSWPGTGVGAGGGAGLRHFRVAGQDRVAGGRGQGDARRRPSQGSRSLWSSL